MATVSFVFSMCSGNNIPVESHWALKNLYSNGNEIEIPLDHNPAISFLKEGKISGETGCNRFFGSYEEPQAGQLVLSEMGATKMACPDNEMAIEDMFLSNLGKVNAYRIEGDKLELLQNDKVVMTFEKTTLPEE